MDMTVTVPVGVVTVTKVVEVPSLPAPEPPVLEPPPVTPTVC